MNKNWRSLFWTCELKIKIILWLNIVFIISICYIQSYFICTKNLSNYYSKLIKIFHQQKYFFPCFLNCNTKRKHIFLYNLCFSTKLTCYHLNTIWIYIKEIQLRFMIFYRIYFEFHSVREDLYILLKNKNKKQYI